MDLSFEKWLLEQFNHTNKDIAKIARSYKTAIRITSDNQLEPIESSMFKLCASNEAYEKLAIAREAYDSQKHNKEYAGKYNCS